MSQFGVNADGKSIRGGTVTQPSREELDAWVLSVAPRAMAYALTLLRNSHQAEDVVQECFCRLLAKADTYDLLHDGLKILLRAITNACINLKVRGKPVISFHVNETDSENYSPNDPADKLSLNPELQAIGHELQHAVAQALEQLPTAQRAALELKSLGHSQQEIAEILGTTSNHVGVLIHRARNTMAQLLAPYLETTDLNP
jgi:RNA polymerase sigma-70 factor (ECF subfamily)